MGKYAIEDAEKKNVEEIVSDLDRSEKVELAKELAVQAAEEAIGFVSQKAGYLLGRVMTKLA